MTAGLFAFHIMTKTHIIKASNDILNLSLISFKSVRLRPEGSVGVSSGQVAMPTEQTALAGSGEKTEEAQGRQINKANEQDTGRILEASEEKRLQKRGRGSQISG